MKAPAVTSALRSPGLVKGLAWFSLGLGLAELLAPRAVARATGQQGREAAVRACGVREAVTGIGLLASPRPAPWLWARVAGDAVDAALLGSRARRQRAWRGGAGVALAAVAAVTLLDLAAAAARSRTPPRRAPLRDYSGRSGFPGPAESMRGRALAPFLSNGSTASAPR